MTSTRTTFAESKWIEKNCLRLYLTSSGHTVPAEGSGARWGITLNTLLTALKTNNMSRRYKDLTGQKFGRVTALECVGQNDHGNSVWRCRCDCGVEFQTLGFHLTRGETQSCGCLRVERATEVSRKRIILTWKDIKEIDDLISVCFTDCEHGDSYKDIYEEVLKRFNEQRNKCF